MGKNKKTLSHTHIVLVVFPTFGLLVSKDFGETFFSVTSGVSRKELFFQEKLNVSRQ